MAPTGFQGTARFELLECLGRGGMGIVYSARDRETGERVALKLLDTQAPEGLTRFKQEFRAVQAIRHPNLVALGELVEVEDEWFYTMELIEGTDLNSAVTYGAPAPAPVAHQPTVDIQRAQFADTDHYGVVGSRGHTARFNETRLRGLLPQLVDGLDELHRHGKVHRDIKPSNILVTADDRAVLLDFGMVFDTEGDGRVTGTDVVLGTGAYMAPEQARSEYGEPKPPADWYALGVLLYEVLAGRLPFEGSMLEVLMRKQKEDVVPPQVINEAVPTDLDRLCMRLLARDPQERPDAAEIRALLGVSRRAQPESAVAPAQDAPLFVGRTSEIEEVVELTTTHYGPVTVVVQGASGMGKTATIDQILARVRADVPDGLLLLSRCYERESVPFRGVDNVVDGLASWLRDAADDLVERVLPEHVELLTHAFPSLGRVPAIRRLRPIDVSSLSQHERRMRVFSTLSELVSNLSAHRQIVIHIDDMQWAGADTWAVLEALMRFPRRPQVSLLLARRPPEDGADPAADLPDVHVFELQALAIDEAETLAARVLASQGGDVGLASVVAADTRGHPMFVQQLSRYLASHDVSSQPALLEDVLRVQVDSLSSNAAAALEVLCLAAVPLQQRTVALASGVTAQKLIGSVIVELRDAGLVRGGGPRPGDRAVFYHDRIRAVVVDGIDAPREARLHGRLADALEETGEAQTSPDILLRHLLAAGYDERAARGAVEAAESAAGRLAFEQAVALFESALSLGVFEGAELAALKEQLAEALVNAGRSADAADIFSELAEDAARGESLRLRRRAAEQLLFSGHLERGLRGLDKVLEEVGEKLPASTAGSLWRVLKERTLLRMRPLKWREVDPSDVTASQRELLELYSGIAVGLSLVDNVRAAGYMARALRLALRVGDREQVTRALALEAIYCASQSNDSRARKVAALVAEVAADTSAPFAQAYLRFSEAAIAFFVETNYLKTLRSMVAAEAHVREGAQTTSWESDTARAYQCFCLMYRGELLELTERVTASLREAEARGSKYGSVTLRSRIVLPGLAADRPAQTLSELERVMSEWAPGTERYLVQHFYALHSHAEIALYTGDTDRARQMFAEQEAPLRRSMMLRLAMVEAEVAFARARLAISAAARAQGPARKELVQEGLRFAKPLRRSKAAAARPWAGLVDAAVARLRGDDYTAVDLLQATIVRLDDTQNFCYSMMARAALGHALGEIRGRRLQEEAAGWAMQNGVVDMLRFSRLAVPGWYLTG